MMRAAWNSGFRVSAEDQDDGIILAFASLGNECGLVLSGGAA